MDNMEIYRARALHRQLKELLKTQERGEATERTVQQIKGLCDGVVQAVADPFCHEKIREVERLSDELFYLDKRSRWSRGPQPGAMLLRRLVYRVLDALDERLRILQKLPSSTGGAEGGTAASIH
jgi:hypothetical protein